MRDELEAMTRRLDRAIAEEREGQRQFHLLTAAELGDQPETPWLVDQVLPLVGLALLFGQSGSAKTFLGLDLVAAVAGGEDWFGHRVEQGPGVVLALEGQAGIRRRVEAWAADRGREFPGDVHFSFDPFRLNDPSDVEGLADEIDAKGARRWSSSTP